MRGVRAERRTESSESKVSFSAPIGRRGRGKQRAEALRLLPLRPDRGAPKRTLRLA